MLPTMSFGGSSINLEALVQRVLEVTQEALEIAREALE